MLIAVRSLVVWHELVSDLVHANSRYHGRQTPWIKEVESRRVNATAPRNIGF